MKPGKLVEKSEEEFNQVGTHAGFPFYTVGQRKGLGGGFTGPRYVLQVDAESNRVVIGEKERLLRRCFTVDRLNWLSPEPQAEIQADVQVRYRSSAAPATVKPSGEISGSSQRLFSVEYAQPVEAICPGQSAVFFQGDRLIGGGRIREVTESDS